MANHDLFLKSLPYFEAKTRNIQLLQNVRSLNKLNICVPAEFLLMIPINKETHTHTHIQMCLHIQSFNECNNFKELKSNTEMISGHYSIAICSIKSVKLVCMF